jgi:hypothetical protein
VIDVDRDPGLVIDGDAILTRPNRAGDCTCMRCCRFRRSHFIARAVLFTLVAVGSFVWLSQLVAVRERVAVMIIATIATGGAVLCWGKPLRRLVHTLRPRSKTWPPPIEL